MITPSFNTAARLLRSPVWGNLMGIYMPLIELMENGVDPEELGLLSVKEAGESEGPVELPQPTNVALDVGTGADVRLLRHPDDTVAEVDENAVLAAVEFNEQHPVEWLDGLAADGKAIVAFGSMSPAAAADMGEWLDSLRVCVVPVMRWIGDEGVGVTRRPYSQPADEEEPIQRFVTSAEYRFVFECLESMMNGPDQSDDKLASNLDELASRSSDDHIAQLAAFPLAWDSAIGDAVAQKVYESDEMAAGDCLRVAVQRLRHDGAPVEWYEQSHALAGATMRKDRRVSARIVQEAMASGPLQVAVMAFFLRAMERIYERIGAQQNRPAIDLVRQVLDQTKGME